MPLLLEASSKAKALRLCSARGLDERRCTAGSAAPAPTRSLRAPEEVAASGGSSVVSTVLDGGKRSCSVVNTSVGGRTGCPGRLWSLLLWRYSSPAWPRCCAACSG